MIKRFGTPPKAKNNHRLRPGAYAVLVRDNQVLLTFQEEPKPEYQIPGGGIDAGEHIIPALRREILEETGWGISTPLRLGAFREYTHMPEYGFWAEKLCHIYLARPVMRMGEPTETGHHSKWCTFDEALDLVPNQGAQHFLRSVLRTYY